MQAGVNQKLVWRARKACHFLAVRRRGIRRCLANSSSCGIVAALLVGGDSPLGVATPNLSEGRFVCVHSQNSGGGAVSSLIARVLANHA